MEKLPDIFEEMVQSGKDPATIIKVRGLKQVSDVGVIYEVLLEHC